MSERAPAPELDIDPAKLWAEDPSVLEKALDELAVDRLEENVLGIAIVAPARMVATACDRLPIGCVYTASLRQAKRDRLREQLLLVATCVETRRTVAVRACPPRERLNEPLMDDDDPGEGATGLSLVIDAFERLELPREPGTWVIRLLLRERSSNAVTVRFDPEPDAYQDEAVEAFMRERAATISPTRMWPPRGDGSEGAYPAYGDEAFHAPEIPAEHGLVIEAPRVFLREGSPCVLHGSFRLFARERDVVDLDAWRADTQAREQDWRAMTPNAVLPVTLVVTGSAFVGPRVFELALPSFDALASERTLDDGTNTYSGCFSLDLEAIGGLMGEPQTHFIYAFAGELWARPVLVGVVTPEMLPEGHGEAR